MHPNTTLSVPILISPFLPQHHPISPYPHITLCTPITTWSQPCTPTPPYQSISSYHPFYPNTTLSVPILISPFLPQSPPFPNHAPQHHPISPYPHLSKNSQTVFVTVLKYYLSNIYIHATSSLSGPLTVVSLYLHSAVVQPIHIPSCKINVIGLMFRT